MKKFSLKFSDPNVEKEFEFLKQKFVLTDFPVTIIFLIVIIITFAISAGIKETWNVFIISLCSILGLLLVCILFKLFSFIKKQANFVTYLILLFFLYIQVVFQRKALHRGVGAGGALLFMRAYGYACIEFILIFRFTVFYQQILAILLGTGLRVGLFVWIDSSIFAWDTTVRLVLFDLLLIVNFYCVGKRERQVFHAFYEYRESFAKFKDLLSNYLPQSLIIMKFEEDNLVFFNKAFSILFEIPNQGLQTNQIGPQSLEDSKIELDSLEINCTTIREVSTTRPSEDFGNGPLTLHDIIQKISINNAIAEKAWTLNASSAQFHKLFEVILKKIKWDEDDCIAIIFNDITYQENILALKLADENKNKILSTVSHELRTPLNAIIGILQICEKQVQNLPKVKEYLELCKDNAYLLLSLVNSLLDLQQIGQGKLKINSSKIEVRKVLNEVVRLFHFQTRQSGVNLSVHVEDDVPQYINNDENRIKQILINLIANAFKFTFEGEIKIIVSQDSKNLEFLILSVIDTGVGIKEEDQSKLFRMYGKLEDKEGVNKHGVGLGLTIANTLSLALSGKTEERGIEVESKVGSGTKFSFQLLKDLHSSPQIIRKLESSLSDSSDMANRKPNILSFQIFPPENLAEFESEEFHSFTDHRTKIPSYNVGDKSLKMNWQKSEPPDSYIVNTCQTIHEVDEKVEEKKVVNIKSEADIEINKFTILVVDDNPFNLLVAENILQDLGFLVITARGGKEAIEFVKTFTKEKQNFKLILMDCQMPIMDGYEATRILKQMMKNKEVPVIPIIALTANTSKRDIERCYESGMDDFLSKPLLKHNLLEILKKKI